MCAVKRVACLAEGGDAQDDGLAAALLNPAQVQDAVQQHRVADLHTEM
jgi:hypothetical protein